MCLEDYRLGREQASGQSVVTVTGPATVQLCGANPNRTFLFISGDGATTVWIGPQGAPLGNLKGIALPGQDPTVSIRIQEWGHVVTAPWFAFVNAGTVNITVFDSALAKQ